MECGWDSAFFFLTEVALIGHLSVKAVTQKDSCPGRSWLALATLHRGAPLVSLYLTEGGYGSTGTLGSIQKCITPLCFHDALLCSSGEAVKFSPVSAPVFQCLQPWGCGVLEHPALGQALRGACSPSHACAAHSWALFLLGFVFVNFPFPLPNSQRSCRLRVVCGRGVLVQLFLSEELIVYSWEMLLKVALSMK